MGGVVEKYEPSPSPMYAERSKRMMWKLCEHFVWTFPSVFAKLINLATRRTMALCVIVALYLIKSIVVLVQNQRKPINHNKIYTKYSAVQNAITQKRQR